MATVTLSTTPTQIDDGTSYTVLVTNTGATPVDLSRGGRLRPGQTATVYPEGAALTAAATSGTGTVTTATTAKPLPNPSDPAALAARPEFTGTYALKTSPRIGPDRRGFVVATGSWAAPAAANLQATAGTCRSAHVALADCTDLRLVYGGYYVADPSTQGVDTDISAAYPINVSIEYAGTIYRVTFGGRTTGTVDPGGTITSDPVALQIPKGATFYVRTFINSTSWYGNVASYSSGGSTGGFTATTDLTAPGSGSVTNAVHWIYTPFVILGTPTDRTIPTVAIIGDSISVGVFDGSGAYNYVQGGGGYIHRALAASVGYVHLGHGGQKVADWIVDANRFRRLAMVNGCTHAVVELGVNDVMNGGASLATVQANLITLWGYLTQRGIKVWQTTITPRTTSTDSWATVGNQTTFNSSWETTRAQLNDWLRAGAAVVNGAAVAAGTAGALTIGQSGHPLAGYFEIADLAESARNSGLWKAGIVADGLHPNATGAAALAAGITPASFT